jgi:hypothetical protein
MRGTRRQFLIGAAAFAAAGVPTSCAFAQTVVPPHPDPAKFESGDFIWPAKENAFIPFFSPDAATRLELERQQWEAQKAVFLQEARASGNPEALAAAERVENLSYRDFRSLYFEDRPADAPREFSVPFPDVGHCAIIDIDAAGERWVVESTPQSGKRYESIYTRFPKGVVRIPYAKWIDEHKDYKVWHGRLDGHDAASRAKIAEASKVFLDKDYWFWSFDLADETAFYCSKLLWRSTERALGVSLDGDLSTGRNFWVSPKRLINAKTIVRLHNPGTF